MIRKLHLITIALLLFSAQSAFASYSVTIDTSSLAGQTGYLDMNFAAGMGGSTGASATVLNFSPGGGLLDPSGPDALSYGYSATLPSSVNLPDSGNDYFQGITTFGNSITFLLNLTGSSGTFTFSLQDSNGIPLFSVNDPNGWGSLFSINLTGNGVGTINDFSGGVANVAPVPLPQAFWLLVTGLAGIVGIRRSRRA